MADLSDNWLSGVIIAVSVFAGVLLLALLAVLVWYCCCRKQPEKPESQVYENEFESLSLSSVDKNNHVTGSIPSSPRSPKQESYFTMPERRMGKNMSPIRHFPPVNPMRRYRAKKRHSLDRRRLSAAVPGVYIRHKAPRLRLSDNIQPEGRRAKSHLGVSTSKVTASGAKQRSHVHVSQPQTQPWLSPSSSAPKSVDVHPSNKVIVSTIGVDKFGNTSHWPVGYSSLQGKPFRVAGDQLTNGSASGQNIYTGNQAGPNMVTTLPILSNTRRLSGSSEVIGPVLTLEREPTGRIVTSQQVVVKSAEIAYASGNALW